MKIRSRDAHIAARAARYTRALHGFSDLITRLGDPERDVLERTQFGGGRRLMRRELEEMYEFNGLASSIIDVPSDDATRPAVHLDADEDLGGVEQHLEDLRVYDGTQGQHAGIDYAANRALKLARLFGGAAVIPVIRDGRQPWQPVDWSAVAGVDEVIVHHRFELFPQSWDRNGQVMLWSLASDMGANEGELGNIIHASRVFPILGADLTALQARNNLGWGAPIMHRVFDDLRRDQTVSDQGARTILYKNALVFRTPGLVNQVQQDNGEQLRTRLTLMSQARSINRLVPLDIKDELTHLDTNLSGIDTMLKAFQERLCASARMPAVKLFGLSPSGFSTGDVDLQIYYDLVNSSLLLLHRVPLYRWLAKLVMRSSYGPTGGQEPATWKVKADALWEPTEQEKASTRQTEASTVVSLVGAGVMTTGEARRALAHLYTFDPPKAEEADAAPSTSTAAPLSESDRLLNMRLSYESGVLYEEPDIANPLRQALGLPEWTEEARRTWQEQRAKGGATPSPAPIPNAAPPAPPVNRKHGLWEETYEPTAAMAEAAARGLELREEFGRGGTQVGVRRAVQIKGRQPISLRTVRRMRAYFGRHDVDRKGEGWGDRKNPSAGWIAWLLWGGDAGRAWAEQIWRDTKEAREQWQRDNAASRRRASRREMIEAMRSRANAAPRSCAVVVRVPNEVAALLPPEAREGAHVTVLYLPDVPDDAALLELLRESLEDLPPMRVDLGGLRHFFNDEGQLVFWQDVCFSEWAIYGMRGAVVSDLLDAGLRVSRPDDWTPHLTLTRSDDPRAAFTYQLAQASWWIGELEVWRGDEVLGVLPLGKQAEMDDEADESEDLD